VNFCLSCIIDDILALPDITEVESHRLSELCRILHALEGLFIDDPEQVYAYAIRCLFHFAHVDVASLCRWVCPGVAQVLVSFRTLGTLFLRANSGLV
jgi:hypothetical protein